MPTAPVVPGLGVGSMPVGRRRNPRLRHGLGERWAQLRRAPRPVPTLLCAGLGLRGPSVDLLSRPPGWLGGNPWGKGAGQRVSTGGGGRTPQGGGGWGDPKSRGVGGGPQVLWVGMASSRSFSRTDPALSCRTGVPWRWAGESGELAARSRPGWAHARGRNTGTGLPAGSAWCRAATPRPEPWHGGSYRHHGGHRDPLSLSHHHWLRWRGHTMLSSIAPWSSSNAATAQSGPNLFPIQSESSVAQAASASLGACARLRGHGGRRPSSPSNVVFLGSGWHLARSDSRRGHSPEQDLPPRRGGDRHLAGHRGP